MEEADIKITLQPNRTVSIFRRLQPGTSGCPHLRTVLLCHGALFIRLYEHYAFSSSCDWTSACSAHTSRSAEWLLRLQWKQSHAGVIVMSQFR